MTNRTQDEIVSRIEEIKASDFFGFMTNDLLARLDFSHVKPYLKEGVTGAGWEQAATGPLEAIRDYLPFAWGKANGCRGISAGRSINHMQAWLWLAGYSPEVCNSLDDYEHYGKAQLVFCSALVGFDWRAHDDGNWVNSEDGPSLSKARIDVLASEWTRKAEGLKQAEAS